MNNGRSALRNRTSCRQIASSGISIVAVEVVQYTHSSNETGYCVVLSAGWIRADAIPAVHDSNCHDSDLYGSVLRVGTAVDVRANGRYVHDPADFGFDPASCRVDHAAADCAVDPASCRVADHAAVGYVAGLATYAVVDSAVDFSVDPATYVAVVDSVARCAVAERVAGPVVDAVDFVARCVVAVAAERAVDPAADVVDSARCAVAAVVAERAVGSAAAVEPAADSVAVVDCVAAVPAVSVPVVGRHRDDPGR